MTRIYHHWERYLETLGSEVEFVTCTHEVISVTEKTIIVARAGSHGSCQYEEGTYRVKRAALEALDAWLPGCGGYLGCWSVSPVRPDFGLASEGDPS